MDALEKDCSDYKNQSHMDRFKRNLVYTRGIELDAELDAGPSTSLRSAQDDSLLIGIEIVGA
jgi:hypothetical protein